MVKVTRRVREQAIAALKKKEELQSTLNREPTVEEIARAMGQPKEDVVLAMEAIMEPSSLYDPAYSDGRENICLIDQVQDKTGENDWLDEMLLREAMEALSAREKKILSLRFLQERLRSRSAVQWVFHKHRSPALKRARCSGLKLKFDTPHG